MATGLTTLRHLRDNKIADKVAAQGEWLKGKLAELQKRYPVIGHVRGLGLMIGIEIVKPNEAQDHMGCYPADGELSALLQKKCFEAGLILERGGRHGCVLRLLPSLLISDAELDVFLDKFEQAPAGRRRKTGLSGVSDRHVHIESDSCWFSAER